MCTRQSVKCVVVRIFSIVTRKMEKELIYIHHHHHHPSFGMLHTDAIHIAFTIAYTTDCVALAHNIYTTYGWIL